MLLSLSLFFLILGIRELHLLMCGMLRCNLCAGYLRSPQWQHHAALHRSHVPHWLWQVPWPRPDVWQLQKVNNRCALWCVAVCMHVFKYLSDKICFQGLKVVFTVLFLLSSSYQSLCGRSCTSWFQRGMLTCDPKGIDEVVGRSTHRLLYPLQRWKYWH